MVRFPLLSLRNDFRGGGSGKVSSAISPNDFFGEDFSSNQPLCHSAGPVFEENENRGGGNFTIMQI